MFSRYTDPVYIHRFTVPADAVDINGHVNNVKYVQWMQDIAVHHYRDAGGNPPMEAIGATWVARKHTIEYLRPAFEGEEIALLTWVANVQRVRSERKYKFVRAKDRVVIARGSTEWVLMNVASGRPVSVPAEVLACFSLLPEDADPELPIES
jgi:acyl-CoA thioester hydrolase